MQNANAVTGVSILFITVGSQHSVLALMLEIIMGIGHSAFLDSAVFAATNVILHSGQILQPLVRVSSTYLTGIV